MRNKRLIAIFSVLLAITLVVLLSSIIFSVKTINTRCLNRPLFDEALDAKIVASTGISKGKSIFLVDESKAMASVHKAVPDVRVINLESKPPNRITVHYVRLFDYYEIASGGYYYPLTFDGRVIEQNDAPAEEKIAVISERTGALSAGDYIYKEGQREILKEITASFERLDLKDSRAVERFSFIDLENDRDCVYIGLRGTAIMLKIYQVSDLDTLFAKIRLGYSVFLSPKFDRQPNDKGQYQMISVVSPDSATGTICDYID